MPVFLWKGVFYYIKGKNDAPGGKASFKRVYYLSLHGGM